MTPLETNLKVYDTIVDKKRFREVSYICSAQLTQPQSNTDTSVKLFGPWIINNNKQQSFLTDNGVNELDASVIAAISPGAAMFGNYWKEQASAYSELKNEGLGDLALGLATAAKMKDKYSSKRFDDLRELYRRKYPNASEEVVAISCSLIPVQMSKFDEGTIDILPSLESKFTEAGINDPVLNLILCSRFAGHANWLGIDKLPYNEIVKFIKDVQSKIGISQLEALLIAITPIESKVSIGMIYNGDESSVFITHIKKVKDYLDAN